MTPGEDHEGPCTVRWIEQEAQADEGHRDAPRTMHEEPLQPVQQRLRGGGVGMRGEQQHDAERGQDEADQGVAEGLARPACRGLGWLARLSRGLSARPQHLRRRSARVLIPPGDGQRR